MNKGLNGAHILILDDDATFVAILARALRRRGHRVSEALHVEAALTLARADAPQLAVVDLKIAQESGLDVLTPLLACEPAMRILILTGYSSIATAVAAIKLGAWDYACKPLDADEILRKLGLGDAMPETDSFVPEQPLSVERLEWEHIQRVLTENAGNISATARSLGMHRRTLQRKLLKRPVRQ
ncbi:MAG: response regulator transcription factor [Pseudomonadales bacterium]|jgi:two-component system response regulator RegA|nr:response regulator transcription factor [Pseudomonadales bacterium]